MDMRTGIIYNSSEEAKLNGVKEKDLLKVSDSLVQRLDKIEQLKKMGFPKNPFGSIRNKVKV